jgi:hypothetical protein
MGAGKADAAAVILNALAGHIDNANVATFAPLVDPTNIDKIDDGRLLPGPSGLG